MSDKEIIDKLIDLTDGTIDHFDREDAMDMLYEVKRLIDKRVESSFCKNVLEKIKAEIADMEKEYEIRHDYPRAVALNYAISIINKYMEEGDAE